MKRVIVSVVSLCIVFAGCATTKPQLTREEWLDTTTRYYDGVSKDEVLKAAERLFRLADGNDFKIVHAEDELYATRNWLVYVVLAAASGTDYWRVTTKSAQNGVKVSVQVNTQSQTIAPMATTSGSWTATTLPMAGTPVQGTAIYDVFWARMDYLLGKRTDWMDCKQAGERVKKGITWGLNEALCNCFNIKDDKPSP
ncbi:MAG: hypothetical protein V2A69_09620 [Pseudomonadota bacterium]